MLFNTWSKANRVINTYMYTTFTREEKEVGYQNVGYRYYEYTRIKRMSYSYVGMDKKTAFDCAAYYNKFYTRYYLPMVFRSGEWVQGDPTFANLKCVKGAEAVPTHMGGGMWKVDINVNESLPQPYRQMYEYPKIVLVWQEFEDNPEILTHYFRGYVLPKEQRDPIYGTDFIYEYRDEVINDEQ